MTANPVLVELVRGPAVESRHRGALAIVDTDGAVWAAIGDVDRPVYPRSAVKGLQALPLVESGAAAHWGLGDAELALACASHNGEPAHTATVAAMLAKAGLDVAVLECGVHWPLLDTAQRALVAAGQTPIALHNNCSGKHAGFVCLGAFLGERLAAGGLHGYGQAAHPLMREVGAAIAAVTGVDLSRQPRAIDGCSIPTYAIPLRSLALGFARFGSGIGLPPVRAAAARRLRAAVAAQPFMLAGSGRFDTRVTERFGERAFVKVGAEGVYCAALPELGWGVALKIDDGNTARAAEVVLAATLEALLRPPHDDAAWLRELSDTTLRNWNGVTVGGLRATADLRAALQSGAPA